MLQLYNQIFPLASSVKFWRGEIGGGGGSRTPVRKAQQSEAYTLIQFASSFAGGSQERARTDSRLAWQVLLEIFRRRIPSQPAERRLSPPCGPGGGDAPPLIRQRKQTAYWQLSFPTPITGGVGPPACLLSANASVETETPPLIYVIRRSRTCQEGRFLRGESLARAEIFRRTS
jgi:hypothetical protein